MLSHRAGGPTPRRGLVERKDENAKMKSLSSIDDAPTASHKTPARSVGKRRAFGDISNRKQQPTGQPLQGAARKPTTSKTVSFQTPRESSLKPTSKPTIPRSVALEEATPFARKAYFTLPQRTPSHSTAPAAASVQQPRAKLQSTTTAADLPSDAVDDIELPAGRLWKDQHNDDYDDETTVSEEALLSNEEVMRLRYQYEKRVLRRQEEATKEELEQGINAVWKRDDEEMEAWKPHDVCFETSIDDLLNTLDGFELSLKEDEFAFRGLDDDISI